MVRISWLPEVLRDSPFLPGGAAVARFPLMGVRKGSFAQKILGDV